MTIRFPWYLPPGVRNLNDLLVEEGLARVYYGGKKS